MVEQISDYHDNVRRDVLPFLPAQAGRVLDFGGGIGATSACLKREGRAHHVVVADQVQATLPDVDAKVVGDLDDPRAVETAIAAYGPFDTILCLDILEHLRDPWSTLGALKKSLARGGTIVVSVPNVNYTGITMPLLLSGSWELADQGPLDRTHLRWFTRRSVVALLEQAGLAVERVVGTVGGKSKILNALTFGVLERFFAVQYIVVGRNS